MIWRFKSRPRLNSFPQILQLNGLSPVCILRCCIKLRFEFNVLPQVLQLYIPVCIMIWRFKSRPRLNFFPQVLQLYGLSPVCILRCTRTLVWFLSSMYSQMLHQVTF